MTQRRFVLLDRDGTLIVDRNYLGDPEGVELLPGAVAGLRRMKALGLGLAIVTNQSGIARGRLTERSVAAVHDRLRAMLAREGIVLDGIYVCPHGPDDDCACRKPRPGLVFSAIRRFQSDAKHVAVIGDIGADVEAAARAGALGILVPTERTRQAEIRNAPIVVSDLVAAVRRALEFI